MMPWMTTRSWVMNRSATRLTAMAMRASTPTPPAWAGRAWAAALPTPSATSSAKSSAAGAVVAVVAAARRCIAAPT
ncbi:hypothetical protein G6F65_022822 [Rhizopus arrhizus]|nr:hypothetical protein G6F65_022822 [Rhizopus arrhizus]